jgi:membrane protein DedA with SNARE-associated domain
MADMHATARPRSNAARICTIIAFVFAVIAIFLLPPLFGLVGLVLGIVGAVLGDKPLGWYAAAASVAGAIIGMIIAYAILNS